jgi:uncharacterized protein (TIGR03083 family)
MADDTNTWRLIHAERSALADQLDTLSSQQWTTASWCGTWTVHVVAAHILAGAEQTPAAFATALAASGFRFNTMIDRAAHRLARLEPAEIINRLRARTSTTNHPPAPVMAMLGEVVVHSADLRQPLGLPATTPPEAARACLEMYKTASFPVGGKKRIRGLRLRASDVDWSCGEGPEVAGPAQSLLLAMTGRAGGLGDLDGPGVAIMRERMAS